MDDCPENVRKTPPVPLHLGGFTADQHDPFPPGHSFPSQGGLVSRSLRHGDRGLVERRSGKAVGGVALGRIAGVPDRGRPSGIDPVTALAAQLGVADGRPEAAYTSRLRP